MQPLVICQHVDELKPNDGVGESIRSLHRLLHSSGYRSYISVLKNAPLHEGGHIRNAAPLKEKSVCHILHAPSPLYPLLFLKHVHAPRILFYHNVTPSYFFTPLTCTGDEPQKRMILDLAHGQTSIRRKLVQTSDFFHLAVGVSNFNRKELIEMGFARTDYLPNIVALNKTFVHNLKESHRPHLILGSTGRVAPNKNLESHIRLLALLRKFGVPARLHHAGSIEPYREYFNLLNRFASALGVQEDTLFYGKLTPKELERHYQSMDIYLSMSLHEGFSIPLLEAMSYHVPVVALDRGAVRETMDGAGVLISDDDPLRTAELIIKIHEDKNFRHNILKHQSERMNRYHHYPFRSELVRIIERAKEISDHSFNKQI